MTKRRLARGAPTPDPKKPKERKQYRTRKNLDEADRDSLTAALLRHLIRPGLVPACEIIIEHMLKENDLASAHSLVRTAKELIQRGFPEPGPGVAAQKLRKELAELEDDLGEASGGGEEGAELGAEEEDVGEGGPGLLQGDEDIPTVPPLPGSS